MAIEPRSKPGVHTGSAPAGTARASCASRHAAIMRELTSYTKYKRWADERRGVFPAERDRDAK